MISNKNRGNIIIGVFFLICALIFLIPMIVVMSDMYWWILTDQRWSDLIINLDKILATVIFLILSIVSFGVGLAFLG